MSLLNRLLIFFFKNWLVTPLATVSMILTLQDEGVFIEATWMCIPIGKWAIVSKIFKKDLSSNNSIICTCIRSSTKNM